MWKKPNFRRMKDRLRQKKKRKERKVIFPRINWDVWFYQSISSGDGFIITQSAAVTLDGKITKSQYGANSPLFGTSYEDEQAFAERHRCECGTFKGRQFEGDICPICKTKVESRPVNIKMTGWFMLGDNVVINPHWYKIFIKVIGKEEFPQIISSMERVDKNGNREKAIPGVDYTPLSPYAAIGIDGFFEKYDEILDYFGKKKKKFDDVEYCKKHKAKAFIHHIPIYSTVLRPHSSTADTLYFNGIEKDIHPLFNLTESLRNCEPIEKKLIQERIQFRINRIWEYNFTQINRKEGFIRNKLISGALNYTSRCVIVPDPTLRVDEVGLPYHAFRVLFKIRIIYWIKVLDKVSLAKAYDRWLKSLQFDQHVYDIMNYIIEQEEPMILLNRNPTLNLYSLLRLKIRYIKTPDKRETVSLPETILPGLNADFDGDVLNMIALVIPAVKKLFEKFDPRHRYMISRTTGRLDPKFGVTSTDIVNLYNFATMTFPEALEDEVADKDLDKVFLPKINQMILDHDRKLLIEKEVHEAKRDKSKFPTVKMPDDIMW